MRRALTFGVALVATLGSSMEASGEAVGESTPRASRIAHHLLHSARLLGDPGGTRTRLEELGVVFQLFYNQYVAWKPVGGTNPDSTSGSSGSYDFFSLADVEELAGWPGLDVLIHVKGQYDRNINDDVGALSNPIDDADFDAGIYVDELWLQQTFWRDRLRLRLGFLEQQTVFDRNAYANSEDRQFLTTFLDNNAVVPLPNGLGAVLLFRPTPWLELATGFGDADNVPRKPGFDTAFDGADSLTAYFETSLATPQGWLPGSYRVGLFYDGREKEVFGTPGPVKRRGHLGVYLSFDQRVYSEGSEQGLGLFARFGYADPEVNEIAWFWSLGLQYAGLLPGRDRDVLGLGMYQAIGSEDFRDEVDPAFDRETGIELYYRAALLPWMTATTDFQYIIDPGATGSRDDAVVVALRFRVAF